MNCFAVICPHLTLTAANVNTLSLRARRGCSLSRPRRDCLSISAPCNFLFCHIEQVCLCLAARNPDGCNFSLAAALREQQVTVKVVGLWRQTYEIQEKRTFIFLAQPSVTFTNPPSTPPRLRSNGALITSKQLQRQYEGLIHRGREAKLQQELQKM